MNNRFPKNERVTGRTLIRKIQSGKHSFFEYPFRVKWMVVKNQSVSPCQILVIVPKHVQKRAVDRNLIKRRMREAYRVSKGNLIRLLVEKQKHMAFSMTYVSKEILPFDLLNQKIILILQRLMFENEKVTG